MKKNTTTTKKNNKTKRLPIKKGKTRKKASFGVYDEQKEKYRREAERDGVSLSYLINKKLFKDWM